MTLSKRYFVESGRTRPERRLKTMRPKPRARTPRRGFKSAMTPGRSFQSNFDLAALGPASGADLAVVFMRLLSSEGRHGFVFSEIFDSFSSSQIERYPMLPSCLAESRAEGH